MKQIFLTASADQVLEHIVAHHLPQKPSSYNLAFITTASEAYDDKDPWWVRCDKEKLLQLGFNLEEFSITGMSPAQIESKLQDKNGIFVCGGNTFYLLDQVIKSGFDQILTQKINQGHLYIGSSAGSMIIGQRINLVSEIDETSKAPDLKSDGLGIVDFVLLPHWGSPDFQKEYQSGFTAMYQQDVKIIPLSNSQYLYLTDNNLTFEML